MLKIRSIDDDGPDRRIYSVTSDGNPVGPEVLTDIARIAGRLLAENELKGTYRALESALVLDLAAAQRSFFHDGIVFAALDAVNDPVRNPTLTRLDPLG
ncbi:MAG: hypothetical protein M3167_16450 [Acidobacteriota bacterium]|nr:hypothetical protein [Acidobacteriota bacterium]